MKDPLRPAPSLLPRWFVVAVAVWGALAIVTGARTPEAPPTPVPVVEADSTFPPIAGFMMDSLRRGRLHPDTAPSPRPRPRTRRRPATLADSVPPRYSPRSCMPE
jgi:hypothetical protein